MNDLATAVKAAGNRASYDDAVKELLAAKPVLAWILQGTTDEFEDKAIAEIVPYIEEPSVSKIPVNPGLANNDDFINGMPQESKIKDEGVFYYDVRFSVKNPRSDGRKNIRIIVDLEAQNNYNPGYDLVTRGIFYCGRMLSDQAGRNFQNSHYDSLEKVYSIWLCFHCPPGIANTISRYKIVQENIHGDFQDSARYDMLQVVMVRLSDEKSHDEAERINKPSELHKMLYDLFVRDISAVERIKLLRENYGLALEDQKGRLDIMCNLSEGLIEQGRAQGKEEGREEFREEMIKGMLSNGKTPEEIHAFCGIPLDTVLKVKAITTSSVQ